MNRPGLTSTGVRKASSKPARSRAREFALQGLYQHLIGRQPLAEIDPFTRELAGFHKCDAVHFDALLHGCVGEAGALDGALEPLIDRRLGELSPVEHAVLWIGLYELRHCADVPWRVVINECVELAKSYGGTDGHKFVNGVLNAAAPLARPAEVARDRAGGPRD